MRTRPLVAGMTHARQASACERAARHHELRAGLDPLLASCLWGGMYVVSRASFGAIPPITLGLLRVVVGGLTLAMVLGVSRWWRHATARSGAPTGPREARATIPWRARDHARAALCGGFVAGTVVTQFIGTDLASAHDGALLTTVTPLCIVPLAWLLLSERPRARVLAGMLLALAGVVVVLVAPSAAAAGGGHGASRLGDVLLLVSALCWALFTVVGAPLTRRFSALGAATSATLWSILPLAPLAAIELVRRGAGTPLTLTPSSVAAVLYLGWGATALAWLLWYRGLRRLDAGIVAIYFFAQPVVGAVLSALLLHETLAPGFWLGGLVLGAGILIVSWAPARSAQSSLPPRLGA